jgi:hypothetical protein
VSSGDLFFLVLRAQSIGHAQLVRHCELCAPQLEIPLESPCTGARHRFFFCFSIAADHFPAFDSTSPVVAWVFCWLRLMCWSASPGLESLTIACSRCSVGGQGSSSVSHSSNTRVSFSSVSFSWLLVTWLECSWATTHRIKFIDFHVFDCL